ncbi:MAG: chemotaxis protein CheW [Myxococcota bacterium]
MSDEIIPEFLVESREGIERAEGDLLALEAEPNNPELVDRIFRDFHTIKGVCGFLDFHHLERLTHSAENLLSKVRSGKLEINRGIVGVLLASVDAIGRTLDIVEETSTDGEDDHAELIQQLSALEQGSGNTRNGGEVRGQTGMYQPGSAETNQEPPSVEATAAPTPSGEPGAPADDAPFDDPDSVPPLGEVLVAHGIPAASVEAAIKAQDDGDPRRLGEILVRRNQARPDQVMDALHAQEHVRKGVVRANETTIRVGVDLLDTLMNLVGELVLVRNQILQTTIHADDPTAVRNAQRLNHVTTELQEGVMKTRMQPIGTVWRKLPRVVRDLAQDCGKKMRLEMEGEDTELDKTIIEAIKDPLTHLVRNACDHGMETPEERDALGKGEEGVLRLRASHEGGQVVIDVIDDGRGLDAEKIRNRAVEKGILSATQAVNLSEREALNLIFRPGFSTVDKVTNVSGRGVGMDVVRTNIERIGGTIDLSSVVGRGTVVNIKIPLTLAIVPALIVKCDGDSYAIPQVNLLELLRLEGDRRALIEDINGTPVYRLRGNLLPIVFLGRCLEVTHQPPPEGDLHIVVLQANGQAFGLVVDAVRDTEEIVVKPLGKELSDLSVYAGATIMGDGSVALIIDVVGLAARAGVERRIEEESLMDDDLFFDDFGDSEQSLLLFATGTGATAAVPLDLIDRLEEFPSEAVEQIGPRQIVQYRGNIMPLINLAQAVYGTPRTKAGESVAGESVAGESVAGESVAGESEGKAPVRVVVLPTAQHAAGLVVNQLTDIVEAMVTIRPVGRRPGVLGTCVVQDQVVEVLDLDAIVATELPELAPLQEAS